jgi:hypothetical protein
LPSVQTLKQVLEDKKKLKQNKPVYYSSALTIQPFMLLHILEENKNDCTLGFRRYGKFESLSPYYISFTNSGKIKGVQQFRKNEIDKIIDKYKECAKNNKILLILADVPSHSNLLLINPVRKEIELFEPHGKISEDSTWFDRLETMGKSIKKEIVEKFNKKLKEKFTYVSTQSSCPAFQKFEGKFKKESRREGNIIIKDPLGWCTAWSFFYADLRFKFPEMSQDQLIRESMEILTEDPRELREFIRGQWMFIYDKAEELYKGGFITTYTRAKGKKREIYSKTFQEAIKVWKKWLTEQFKKYGGLEEDEGNNEKKKLINFLDSVIKNYKLLAPAPGMNEDYRDEFRKIEYISKGDLPYEDKNFQGWTYGYNIDNQDSRPQHLLYSSFLKHNNMTNNKYIKFLENFKKEFKKNRKIYEKLINDDEVFSRYSPQQNLLITSIFEKYAILFILLIGRLKNYVKTKNGYGAYKK